MKAALPCLPPAVFFYQRVDASFGQASSVCSGFSFDQSKNKYYTIDSIKVKITLAPLW